eukprot:scaffold137293_cov63-Phaeocystis_antarctica.AAC.1
MRAGLPYHVRKIGIVSLNSSRERSARNVAGRSTDWYILALSSESTCLRSALGSAASSTHPCTVRLVIALPSGEEQWLCGMLTGALALASRCCASCSSLRASRVAVPSTCSPAMSRAVAAVRHSSSASAMAASRSAASSGS